MEDNINKNNLDKYFIYKRTVSGPFSKEDIEKSIALNDLTIGDLISKDGKDWQKIYLSKEFKFPALKLTTIDRDSKEISTFLKISPESTGKNKLYLFSLLLILPTLFVARNYFKSSPPVSSSRSIASVNTQTIVNETKEIKKEPLKTINTAPNTNTIKTVKKSIIKKQPEPTPTIPQINNQAVIIPQENDVTMPIFEYTSSPIDTSNYYYPYEYIPPMQHDPDQFNQFYQDNSYYEELPEAPIFYP